MPCPASVVSGKIVSAQHSQTTDLTGLDSWSIPSDNVFVLKLHQEVKSYDSDQNSLKKNYSSSLSDKNLNTDTRIPSEQIISLQNLTNQVKSDVDGNKINGSALSLNLSLPLFEQISLQTDESEPACANLTNSDITDILQQTIVNKVQNICINISEDGTSCTEQTHQANAETLLAHELLAATNEESVSGSPYNSTSGVLSTIEQKAPQPEKGGRILLNAEESVQGCHIETENSSSLEIEPIALQLREKGTLQIGGKREDLQETNSKTDLNFGVNVVSKSPHSFQIVENMEKETSQKTGAMFCLKIIIL